MTPMITEPETRSTDDVEDNPAKAAVMAWAELVGRRGSAHTDTLMQSYQSAAKQLRDDLKAQSDEIKKGLETFSTGTLKALDEQGRAIKDDLSTINMTIGSVKQTLQSSEHEITQQLAAWKEKNDKAFKAMDRFSNEHQATMDKLVKVAKSIESHQSTSFLTHILVPFVAGLLGAAAGVFLMYH
jgi:flagellar motility protein MotE (MotC chaperone)